MCEVTAGKAFILGLGSDVECRPNSPTEYDQIWEVEETYFDSDLVEKVYLGKIGKSYYLTLRYKGSFDNDFIQPYVETFMSSLRVALGKRINKYMRRGVKVRWYGHNLRPPIVDAVTKSLQLNCTLLSKQKRS